MNSTIFRLGITALFVVTSASNVNAQTTAKLVKSELVWAGDQNVVDTDLVRFKDAWFMACCETSQANSQEGVIRIVTSKLATPFAKPQGVPTQVVPPWESVALIHSPTPGKLLSQPRLSVSPDGQLMLTAVGIVPNPQLADPLPKYGGTVQTMAWLSSDGGTWKQTIPVGRMDCIHGKTVWQNKQAFSFSHGSICGNAQTITIALGEAGQHRKDIFEETVGGYFPSDASLTFIGDLGFCLMSRLGERNAVRTGLLGTSAAPFRQWKWIDTNSQLTCPNSIRLADDRVLVVVGMHDERTRTSLCQLNLETGKLMELLEVPSSGSPAHAGIVFHDGHIWISFLADHQNKQSAYLAQVSVE